MPTRRANIGEMPFFLIVGFEVYDPKTLECKAMLTWRRARRPSRGRLHAGEPARQNRRGAPGHGPLQRDHLLQHRLRPTRCRA